MSMTRCPPDKGTLEQYYSPLSRMDIGHYTSISFEQGIFFEQVEQIGILKTSSTSFIVSSSYTCNNGFFDVYYAHAFVYYDLILIPW